MSLVKNEQQSQNLLLKVDPRSTFHNNFPFSSSICSRITVTDKLQVLITTSLHRRSNRAIHIMMIAVVVILYVVSVFKSGRHVLLLIVYNNCNMNTLLNFV